MVVKARNRFNNIKINDLEINENNKELIVYLKEIVNDVEKYLNSGANLIITGDIGVGKTYCIKALINSLQGQEIEKEYNSYDENYKKVVKIRKEKINIVYTTIYEMIEELRKVYNKEESNIDFKDCDLLIVDEVGVQFSTDGERQVLYDIFNYRWENYKPVIAISNCNIKSDSKQKGLDFILGKRIYDRLINTESRIFNIKGISKR